VYKNCFGSYRFRFGEGRAGIEFVFVGVLLKACFWRFICLGVVNFALRGFGKKGNRKQEICRKCMIMAVPKEAELRLHAIRLHLMIKDPNSALRKISKSKQNLAKKLELFLKHHDQNVLIIMLRKSPEAEIKNGDIRPP
jgi:hypothetical protein